MDHITQFAAAAAARSPVKAFSQSLLLFQSLGLNNLPVFPRI